MYYIYIILLHIISTDEDPGLRIESFAVINLRGVSTNKTIIMFHLLPGGIPCIYLKPRDHNSANHVWRSPIPNKDFFTTPNFTFIL